MMTLEALAMDMQKDPENWEIPFMNFVDNFNRCMLITVPLTLRQTYLGHENIWVSSKIFHIR